MCAAALQVDVILPTETRYLSLVGCIGERIGQQMEEYQGDKDAFAYNLNLVLTEATANAIKHSHSKDSDDTVRVTINYDRDDLVIKVYDHGHGFSLESVPAPDLDQLPEGGLGIFLIQSLMDSVTYTKMDDCNVLEIKKKLRTQSIG